MRTDYNLNSKNTLTGTFSWNRDVLDRPEVTLGSVYNSFDQIPLVSNDDSTKFLSVAWRWNPTNSLTNEARFGFNLAPGFFVTRQDFSSGFTVDSSTLPFTSPDINFLPQGRNTRTWAWLDNASWVKGNHVVKFGTQIQRVTIFTTGSGGIYPDYSLGFSNANPFGPIPFDFPVGAANAEISSSDLGNATSILASVAGILNSVSQTINSTSQKSGYVPGAPQDRNYRQNLWSFYLGDSWRLNRKLTLTYGLRWDYFSPVDERDGMVLLPVVPSGSTIEQTLMGNATLDFAGGPSKRGLSQIVSDLLCVPVESIDIITGDTDIVHEGGGSHPGRSMRHAATVFSLAAPDLIAKGRKIAAIFLATTPDNVAFKGGRFSRTRHKSKLRLF